jgi:prepilin-type N-terminal cleavage/methylation domain-containing protein
MSRTSVHRKSPGGFTLVEIMVALSMAAIIFAAVMTAYLFLGRSLTRLVNLQRQEVQSRRTLRQFTQDLSAAIQLTTATSSQVTLTKPIASGTTTVTYTYASGAGTLTRTDSAGTQTLISGLTSFNVSYFDSGGTAISSSPQSVKSAELAFASQYGTAINGTLTAYATVSPRVVLRNKPALQ